MKNKIKISFWEKSLTVAIISSILTGGIFAVALYFVTRILEFRDAEIAIKSELNYNCNVVKKIDVTTQTQLGSLLSFVNFQNEELSKFKLNDSVLDESEVLKTFSVPVFNYLNKISFNNWISLQG